jgi:hypothetical protein
MIFNNPQYLQLNIKPHIRHLLYSQTDKAFYYADFPEFGGDGSLDQLIIRNSALSLLKMGEMYLGEVREYHYNLPLKSSGITLANINDNVSEFKSYRLYGNFKSMFPIANNILYNLV